MPRQKGLIRSITEAVDQRELLSNEPAPPVDSMDVRTAGTTITTDIPELGEPESDEHLVAMPSVPVGDQDPEPEEPEGGVDVVEPEVMEPEIDTKHDDDEEDEEDEEGIQETRRFKDKPEDLAAHGGMSTPHKMMCITYSMLAGGTNPKFGGVKGTCPKGSRLAQIPGSVCYGCYAFAGNYGRPNVIGAMKRRATATRDALKSPAKLDRWIRAIVSSIDRSRDDIFRWHDSGDIMGPKHLEAIVEVARLKPEVRFWLPTKEHGTVRDWIGTYGAGKLPRNLNIRLSAHMLFEVMRATPPTTASSVASGEGYRCPATYDEEYMKEHDHTCGPCRMCWERKTRNVDYAYHGAQYRYRHGLLTHGLLEPKRRGKVYMPPEKPKLWTPTSKVVARVMKGALPKKPGLVKKVIRPE